ncbi:MAG: bifunctional DNA-formamidopyrimidine glycosylase/DNA-(apurinic or apyrimidinic site) lyase [Elusimicrobiota bacterium]
MPELPEVETVRRALEKRLAGGTISSCRVVPPAFNAKTPAPLLKKIAGATVRSVSRRGKYLILELSGGRDLSLHLGMSGRIAFDSPNPHTRFILKTDRTTLYFHDPRRFGRVGCRLPELGPEPLNRDFTPKRLFGALKKSRASVKSLLMDQGVVAGIGNIYATEALFSAGIRPGRAGKSLSLADCVRLLGAIKIVLSQAVKLGGSTLDDEGFLDPFGRPGKFQHSLNIYGRKTGRACAHPLKTTRKPLAGRTSRYCPQCQK